MGLIDLKTNLKSLKYGNDQKGGGSSNQPYIVTPIPDDLTSSAPDFLLRNGYLNPLNSIQDVSRLTRMFLDTKSPNGLLFITKQELLERQNPIQANTDRVYSPLNTLAQAGVVATGYHLNKQGLNPFTPGYYDGGRSGYFFSTRAGSNVDGGVNGGENRLTLLYTSKITDQPLGTFTINPFGVAGPNDQVNLISYTGGPNSALGFGQTNIRIQNPTQTVNPRGEGVQTAFISNLFDTVGYLTPTGSSTINWSYSPDFKQNNSSINRYGVSAQYYWRRRDALGDEPLDTILFDTEYFNRDESVILPVDKAPNTFDKNTGKLKTSPDYLVPQYIDGNVNYEFPGTYKNLSNVFRFRTRIEPEYKNKAAESLIGNLYNTSSLSKDSFYKTKDQDILISSLVPKLPNSIAFRPTNEDTLNSEIANNINQSSPDVYEVPDDIVEGKQKTTTLSSLNPQYFKYNEINNSVEPEDALASFPEFNRETTYKTSATEYRRNLQSFLKENVNNSVSIDQLNYSDILQPTGSEAGAQQNEIDDLKQSDIVKFYFEINNNDSLAATQNWFLFFRAYINDLGDSYKPEWQSYKYIGRAENFYKYSGFSRDISLSFTIYANSRAEMKPIYDKLNYLVGTTAPDYSNAGYMRGNFINLTVGNYLDSVPGIIQGIDLKPSFDAGWDIDRDAFTGVLLNDRLQLPRMIDVTLQFTPIHTFTPRFTSTFIG